MSGAEPHLDTKTHLSDGPTYFSQAAPITDSELNDTLT